MSFASNTRTFLLLHGYQHHEPEGHWLRWLTQELTEHGYQANYPRLPNADFPVVGDWLDVLRRQLDDLENGNVTVICHSLGSLLWLHAAASTPSLPMVDRVLLVAPPSPSVVLADPGMSAFAPPPVTAAQLRSTSSHPVRMVAADNDPYCPEGADSLFATPLETKLDLLPGQAHFDLDAGYGSWPSILRWCLDPTADVSAR